MAVWSGERIGPATTRELLEQIASGERGAQSDGRSLESGATSEQIEEAFQEACARAVVRGAKRGRGLRLASYDDASRSRTSATPCGTRGAARRRRLSSPPFRSPASDPVDELIEREDHEELERLARVILSGLSSRQRAVVALHTRGLRRRQIAEHLDLTSRTVKRSMEQVLAAGRNELLRLAGQGCGEGEQLARLAFGLAGPREARRAQLHLATCGRCGALYERLDLWREHVAGLLPLPAAAEAHSHLLERAIHAGSELLSRLIAADGGVRRHVTETVSHLREQAAASYSRAVDPTPLAGVRPGAVAAAVAGCLAVGGGATYCVEQGVDPIAGIRTIASREQPDRKPKPHQRRVRLSQAPTVPIATPTVPAPTATASATRSPRSRRASRRLHNRRVHPRRRRRRRRIRADRGRKQQRIGQFAAGRRHPASQRPRRGGPSEFGGP